MTEPRKNRWVSRKIGDRSNQNLLRRIHEVLLAHGPMTAKSLTRRMWAIYPNNRLFHRRPVTLSQLMVGRPHLFRKAGVQRTPQVIIWEAIEQEDSE